jgi:hypothetical protein
MSRTVTVEKTAPNKYKRTTIDVDDNFNVDEAIQSVKNNITNAQAYIISQQALQAQLEAEKNK